MSLVDLAERLGLSRTTLSTRWNKEVGTSIPEYVNRIRLEHAKGLLRRSALPVTRIAAECGFSRRSGSGGPRPFEFLTLAPSPSESREPRVSLAPV